MKLRTQIYGLEATLNCIHCGAEVFLAKEPVWGNADILKLFNEASVAHRAEGCKTSEAAQDFGLG